jgi:hypothetical protein
VFWEIGFVQFYLTLPYDRVRSHNLLVSYPSSHFWPKFTTKCVLLCISRSCVFCDIVEQKKNEKHGAKYKREIDINVTCDCLRLPRSLPPFSPSLSLTQMHGLFLTIPLSPLLSLHLVRYPDFLVGQASSHAPERSPGTCK